MVERGDLGGILDQTGQSGRWRQRRCSSREATDLFHEGVGERTNLSWWVTTYLLRNSKSVSSLHLSRIPLARGMPRLDDGGMWYAEVEYEWLLKIGLQWWWWWF